MKCTPPRLVMLRTRGLSGPMFQQWNGSTCIKGVGNAYALGGPLSGPKAVYGITLSPTIIEVSFTQCVSITGPTGIEVQYDGGAWTQVTSVAETSPTVWSFVVPNIDPGDEVRWRYTGGSDTIVDCDEGEDIGDQEIPIQNSLVLAGDFILLETGGLDVILLEDDNGIDPIEGVQLENAT